MYVELHSCSAFSFLEGASLPEEIAEGAAQFGMRAIALLDRDGVLRFTSVSFGSRQAGHLRSYRLGNFLCGFWQSSRISFLDPKPTSALAGSPSAPREKSNRLPKSVPPDHSLQNARKRKGHGQLRPSTKSRSMQKAWCVSRAVKKACLPPLSLVVVTKMHCEA